MPRFSPALYSKSNKNLVPRDLVIPMMNSVQSAVKTLEALIATGSSCIGC
jgi:hypothetical protein